MADDSTIIEGSVKFRDGRKWKSRWCVMRKLSPVADCVQLQLYRDARARAGGPGARCKAALSLQQYLGCEAGFTLDQHSNTLALLCRDLVAVLAFETRERLIQWQVKVRCHLGEARQYLVLVGRARLPAGPARLHLHERRLALTAGVPPRLLGVWELHHLRRYGVVEGRFCFEGGSFCGKGEGLHVLVTDQAEEISHDFDLASRGQLSPKKRLLGARKCDGAESPNSHKAYRPDTRLSELSPVERLLGLPERCHDEGAVSPCWPSTDLGLGDTVSVNETVEGADAAWSGAGSVALHRCMSCMSKLGAMSRSSTGGLTPGAKHFSPAWTMEALQEANTEPAAADACKCPERAPDRPPKPTRLELRLPTSPLAPRPDSLSVARSRSCAHVTSLEDNAPTKIGPYENYDVPKVPSAEIEIGGEYYDTPKRLKECLDSELFKMTKSSSSNALVLKKPCGCLLRMSRRRARPAVLESAESAPAACPCRRVTDWASSWIRAPYCAKSAASSDDLAADKENARPSAAARDALYATIDLSRKTRRKTHPIDPDDVDRSVDPRNVEIDRGPLANYENLNFALSLEYYENAKDLLRRAGVTQAELDAIGANLRGGGSACACGRPEPPALPPRAERPAPRAADDYLVMEPKSLETHDRCKTLPSGYTPMSPIGGFAFDTLKRPARSPIARLLDEKSASNPSLCASEAAHAAGLPAAEGRPERAERRKRSSSADSSRFLEDVKEFERGSDSSIETLRESGAAERRGASSSLAAAGAPATNRDSSSSNDSGVSSCSLRGAGAEFELPATTAAARRHYRHARRAPPRPAPRSRSTDPLRERAPAPCAPPKSSSAEAEVPILSIVGSLKGVVDSHSTSSGTSDMSDYIETLSICSSHSSSDTPVTMRVVRHATSTLRPRSGKEYGSVSQAPPPPGASLPPPAPARLHSRLT